MGTGGVDSYRATCGSCSDSTEKNQDDDNGGAEFEFEDLEEFVKYTVTVQAQFGTKLSSAAQIDCITEEGGKLQFVFTVRIIINLLETLIYITTKYKHAIQPRRALSVAALSKQLADM